MLSALKDCEFYVGVVIVNGIEFVCPETFSASKTEALEALELARKYLNPEWSHRLVKVKLVKVISSFLISLITSIMESNSESEAITQAWKWWVDYGVHDIEIERLEEGTEAQRKNNETRGS